MAVKAKVERVKIKRTDDVTPRLLEGRSSGNIYLYLSCGTLVGLSGGDGGKTFSRNSLDGSTYKHFNGKITLENDQ